MTNPESELPREDDHGRSTDGRFPDTRWSLIESAQSADPATVSRALQELCQLYWYPVYFYVRRRGSSPEDAEDLAQGFFADFLRRSDFSLAEKEKGKLRSYLLKSVSHYLSDDFDKRTALKRGGGQTLISIDQMAAEERYLLEPTNDVGPDLLFEKRWAVTLLESVMQQLRDSYEKQKKALVFDQLQPYLAWNANDAPIADASAALGMTESAVRVSLYRLRRRYGEALRKAILETVLDPAEVEGELDYLFTVIRR